MVTRKDFEARRSEMSTIKLAIHALWIPADKEVKCDECGFAEFTGQVGWFGPEGRDVRALVICKRRGGICKAMKEMGGE